MATIFTRKCDICRGEALKRESFFLYPASSRKQYLVCKKCGSTLSTFLKKKGLIKTMHPKAVGSQKERKLKTKRAR